MNTGGIRPVVGGFGDPREHAAEAIADDVAQGFVSPKATEAIYKFRACGSLVP